MSRPILLSSAGPPTIADVSLMPTDLDGHHHKSDVPVGQTEHGIEHLNAMVQVRDVVGPHRDIKNGHHKPASRI